MFLVPPASFAGKVTVGVPVRVKFVSVGADQPEPVPSLLIEINPVGPNAMLRARLLAVIVKTEPELVQVRPKPLRSRVPEVNITLLLECVTLPRSLKVPVPLLIVIEIAQVLPLVLMV